MRCFMLITCLYFLNACSNTPVNQLTPIARLQTEYPDFHVVDTPARARMQLETALSPVRPFTILVFFGTWCHDSIREVPQLLSLLHDIPEANLRIELIELNREKKDQHGLSELYHITRTPTFVVQQSDQELGRIVEKPAESLSADLLDIFRKLKKR